MIRTTDWSSLRKNVIINRRSELIVFLFVCKQKTIKISRAWKIYLMGPLVWLLTCRKPGVGWQRTPERCDSELVVIAGRLHLADWYTVWPVSALREASQRSAVRVETAESLAWATNALAWATNALAWVTNALALARLEWPYVKQRGTESEEQLCRGAVVTWGVHVRRVSDLCQMVAESSGRTQQRASRPVSHMTCATHDLRTMTLAKQLSFAEHNRSAVCWCKTWSCRWICWIYLYQSIGKWSSIIKKKLI